MSLHFIEHDAGAYHIYLTDARGHRTRIGPRIGWETPREAIDFARKLNKGHEVDPLRPTGEDAPTLLPGLSPSVGAGVVRRSHQRAREGTSGTAGE